MDTGAHESRGDLEVRWVCLHDGYSVAGQSSVAAARRTSPTVRAIAAENLRLARLSGFTRGVEVPLVYDDEPVEVADV